MGNPISKFVQPILDVIPAPKTGDLRALMEAYAKILSEFDDDVLAMASAQIIRSMKTKSMPVPADCLAACRAADDTIRLRRLRSERAKPRVREQFIWTEEMAKKADRLFASEWGRRACQDGVEIAIWDFMVKNQRWPNQREYETAKAASLALQSQTSEFLKSWEGRGGVTSGARAWLMMMNRKSEALKSVASTNNT